MPIFGAVSVDAGKRCFRVENVLAIDFWYLDRIFRQMLRFAGVKPMSVKFVAFSE